MDLFTLAMAKNLAGDQGGGSGLPAVTNADNGKVLKVVNGKWTVCGVVSSESGGDN